MRGGTCTVSLKKRAALVKRYKHTETVTHLHIIIIIISIDACGMVQTKRDFRTDTYLVASAGQIQNLKIFSLT